MIKKFFTITVLILILSVSASNTAQSQDLTTKAEQTMLNATRFMVEEVSTNGGYLWNYLPDMSRRWGEMEAYETMIWVQHPGTASMAHTFLDAYELTGDEYYYEAAEKAVKALIWGQSTYGGWNYMIDFAGDQSLKEWYATIGKNGWRLEEFQHYYGNDTFDDDTTSDAARVILRMYLQKLDPTFKPALDKAINFILESQYPIGGWPQRYPLRYDFNKAGKPDYTHYYTFNDDVVWENINFLVQCYQTLGEERLLDPIYRGMNFYLVTQQPNGGWAQQYDMQLRPAGARTYEPNALLPQYSATHTILLMRFYEYTGDRRFLVRVPDAIAWLKQTAIPGTRTEDGRTTHPTFVELETNRPLYVHRRGSNVIHGEYYYDYEDKNLLSHFGPKRVLNIDRIEREYERVSKLTPEEATRNSPILPRRFSGTDTPQHHYNLNREARTEIPSIEQLHEIINSLDEHNRWLVKHMDTSNPYIGDGVKTELTTRYQSMHVGDETDTSPFRDESDQEYISMAKYIQNMSLLMNYLKSQE